MKVSSGPGRNPGMLPDVVGLPSMVGVEYMLGTGMSLSSLNSSAQPPLSDRNRKSVLSYSPSSRSLSMIRPTP